MPNLDYHDTITIGKTPIVHDIITPNPADYKI